MPSVILNVFVFFVISVPSIVHSWVSCTMEFSKGGEICDNGEETWTVGYGNRSLEAVIEFINCNASRQINNFLWCMGKPCKPIALVGERRNGGFFAFWTTHNNTHLVTKIEFYDVAKYSRQKLPFAVREFTSQFSAKSYVWNISIKHCPRKNRNDVEILDTDGNYAYGSTGYFSCANDHYLVDIVCNQIATNNTTVCGTCARWDRMEMMGCWKAPKVAVNLSLINKVFTPGDELTSEICYVLDYGKQNASVVLSRNNLLLSTPLILRPEHNNMTVYCNAQNKLTKILGTRGKFSEPYTLVVEFGPTGYSEKTICTFSDFESGLYNVTLNMSLSANPPVVEANVFVNDKKKNNVLKLTNGSVGCCGVRVQTFEITIINVTKKNSVAVVFNHKIKNLIRFYDAITDNCRINVATEATPTASITTKALSNLSETTIAVICTGAVIVLVLIAGFLTLHLRKRNANGQDSSPRQEDQPSMIPMTVNPASADSPKADNKGTEAAYEIPNVNGYETIKEGKIGPAYQNVGGASNSSFDEDTAYAL